MGHISACSVAVTKRVPNVYWPSGVPQDILGSPPQDILQDLQGSHPGCRPPPPPVTPQEVPLQPSLGDPLGGTPEGPPGYPPGDPPMVDDAAPEPTR